MKKNKNIPFSKPIEAFSDDRGVFVPFIGKCHALDEKRGLFIKRSYFIYNYAKGIVRGYHFHKKEWKYFVIANGAAKFCAINPDNEKETYTFISSARRPNLVIIPPYFAHGWVALKENTILFCCSTATLEESLKDDIRFDPYKWGDIWKVKDR